MTKNDTTAPVREAIAARGTALLQLISVSPTGYLMLTQDEGADIVTAGFASIDTTIASDDGTAAVSLTDAGKAQLVTPVAPVANKSGFEIETGVVMPTGSGSRKAREGGYPFDKLEVGQSFHVPVSADNETPVIRLQSSVSGARAKFSVATGEQETVDVRTYAKGADGKFAKDANGKRIVATTTTETRDKMAVTKDFTVKAVDASDPKGVGARVWRTA